MLSIERNSFDFWYNFPEPFAKFDKAVAALSLSVGYHSVNGVPRKTLELFWSDQTGQFDSISWIEHEPQPESFRLIEERLFKSVQIMGFVK